MVFKLGERIKNIREQRKISQKELAKKIGVSNSRLSNWELGINRPDVDSLALICKALGISADILLDINTDELNKYTPSEQSLIKKYRLLSAKEQAVVDNLIDGLAPTSSDNTVKTNPNSEIIEKLGVDPTPENGFISHKDMVGKGIAAFGGNKKKTKF